MRSCSIGSVNPKATISIGPEVDPVLKGIAQVAIDLLQLVLLRFRIASTLPLGGLTKARPENVDLKS